MRAVCFGTAGRTMLVLYFFKQIQHIIGAFRNGIQYIVYRFVVFVYGPQIYLFSVIVGLGIEV